MQQLKSIYYLFFLLSALQYGCTTDHAPDSVFHFTLLKADDTNISFNNTITESDSVNVFQNEYMYNGAGVGAGDFNNDGLQDLFFAGSMVSSKLYINKGNFQFQDITEQAGLQTDQWCTGVTIVDINNDGFPDIYLSSSHSANADKRRNKLFINDGKLHFTEQAAAYGLADTGYSTQAAFLDFDKDGDLDMYLLNHRLYSHTANNLQPKDTSGASPAQDKLYINMGVQAGTNHPVFADVTIQAGIKEDGYGLGIVVTDANGDNWPDIYIANDYIGNDLLWINNQDGTFSNMIAASIKYQSYNSMGVDAADINNDLLPDLVTLDMLPESNERKKMMLNSSNQEKFDMQQRLGYEPAYMRNMLHLNNGNRQVKNKQIPFYSEIGQMAGVFETDWSWSILMADFNNDGWKDMHITNGLGKDVTNNDYATFRNAQTHVTNYTFGGGTSQQPLDKSTIASLREEIDEYGSVSMENYFYQNNGDLTFRNISAAVGFAVPSISSGAVYADLDNDGDLDLVVNNINQDAFVWRNELRQSMTDTVQNFLSVQLNGSQNNVAGLGSKLTVYTKGKQQIIEQSPVRGFSSSVDLRLHVGTGTATDLDSVKIQWPDNKFQILRNVKANQFLTLQHNDAVEMQLNENPLLATAFFLETINEILLDYKHTEVQHFDFGIHQPLLQRYSQLGPCIATGDLNADGRTDFFVGGAANQSGKLFFQQADGSFVSSNLVEGMKPEEDLGAVLFDADGDNDLDLLVTGGSSEFTVAKYNQPRLYLNDGKGRFTLNANALPLIPVITKPVTVADYDGDGDMDVFIGGRLLPQQYPQSPRSYLLQNNNGIFTDVTKAVSPALEFAGMIEAALFTDFNNDQKADLIVCGEFTNIRFFKNENNQLVEITNETGLTNMNGFWRSLQPADIDKDGDMDYVIGNMGYNNKYRISEGKPMQLYAKDMDKNGSIDLIPAYYIQNAKGKVELYPALDRNQLAEQVPAVKKKYLLHKDYSTVTVQQLLSDFGKDDWTVLTCETFSTVWIENLGNGKFKTHELPVEAQFAPVNSIVAEDIDADGNVDLIIAGNEYQMAASTGRHDASYGLVLKGNGKGAFTSVTVAASGLLMDGDIKDMKILSINSRAKLLLAAPNDSKLKIFTITTSLKK